MGKNLLPWHMEQTSQRKSTSKAMRHSDECLGRTQDLPEKEAWLGTGRRKEAGLVVCLVEEEREIRRARCDRSFTDMKCPRGPLLDIAA